MISKCQSCKKNHTNVSPWCDDCNKEFDQSWVDHKNQLKSDESTIAKKSEDSTPKTLSSSEKSLKEKEPIMQKMQKQIDVDPATIITQTGQNVTLHALNEQGEIKSTPLNVSENTTPETQTPPQNNVPVVTDESQIGRFEMPRDFLKNQLLESTNILDESTRLLSTQMKRALVKESEVRQPSHEDVALALVLAEKIAKLTQTKINFLKVLR